MPIYVNEGKDIFFTDEFKTLIRSCKELIIERSIPTLITVPSIKEAYRYDFYKLLRELGITEDMVWVTAYINDVTDPTNWNFDSFLTPPRDYIISLWQMKNIRKES